MTLTILLILLILILLLSCLAWRFASRRTALPCPVWMRWLLDPSSGKGVSSRTRRTITNLSLKPGMQVLDAGCGPGRLSIPLAAAVGPDGTVTAMDLQDGMLDIVRERADKNKIFNISFIQGGIGNIDLPSEKYDRAVLITVLGEIPNRETAMESLFKTLKQGGLLLVEETIRDPHFQSRSTVTELAEGVGFRVKEFSGNRFSYTIILEKPVDS
ncbi:class I SAM-dependent methyltransferase [Methanospirillum lacunae]|uniref:Methyltransferase type 11 n=1 Tax=Methanospirillum lacunae TaxID=668570 RepID=A0A2V2N305_9EURY|nr:class I SAM-dependent methyltransferase [Methanospirillum lacunae]PWR72116.1 methyltransferase type 11 [Methanospirillum lacunae]